MKSEKTDTKGTHTMKETEKIISMYKIPPTPISDTYKYKIPFDSIHFDHRAP